MKFVIENFEIHDKLNKKLFDLDTQLLKDDVRERLIEVADLFIQDLNENGIPIDVYDYWLLGSNAAYNYSNESDIDIHVIVDLDDIMKREEIDPAILKLLYTYAKSSFNSKYNIKVKGHEVELYIQDINEPNATNGIYSLKRNEWIKVPVKDEPKYFDIENTELYKEWKDRYNSLNDDEIEQFIYDLYLMRKSSLANDGEFGEGNLVFKQLRNEGILDELKDRKYQVKSKELTLEKLEEDVLCEKHWIEAEASYINGNDKDSYTFAFYATDKKPEEDLKTLIDVISNKQTGTYKQQLNPEILVKLKKMYKDSKGNFNLKLIKKFSKEESPKHLPQITLTDRDLRKNAHTDVEDLDLSEEIKNHLKSNGENKIYIHHINKHEDDNKLNNLVIIGHNNSDLGFAHAYHKILHNYDKPVFTPLTKILPIYDGNTNKLGEVTFKVDYIK